MLSDAILCVLSWWTLVNSDELIDFKNFLSIIHKMLVQTHKCWVENGCWRGWEGLEVDQDEVISLSVPLASQSLPVLQL